MNTVNTLLTYTFPSLLNFVASSDDIIVERYQAWLPSPLSDLPTWQTYTPTTNEFTSTAPLSEVPGTHTVSVTLKKGVTKATVTRCFEVEVKNQRPEIVATFTLNDQIYSVGTGV